MHELGELNKRIRFERDELINDGVGGKINEPNIFSSAWAKVIYKSSREAEAAGLITSTQTVIFVVRWRSDIRPSDRILWKGVRFNIRNPSDLDSRQPFLELETERGVAQ